MQQNSKCRLCGDRDEAINLVISEFSQLAQKESQTRHDWELCQRLKLILENELHKIIWDFEIQTDQLIRTRRPELVLIPKKKKKKRELCHQVDFAFWRVAEGK